MKKQILLAFFLSCFTYLGLHAQCNDPFPPSNSCANVGQPGGVPVICDLDGYCSTTGPFNAIDVPTTFCGSVQNNQWFAFVAGSTNIELEFIVGACNGTNNGTGLQAAVYTECGTPWTQLACTFQIQPGGSSPMILNGLTPGNVYYLMIDGFSGDICDYTIEVNNGSTTAPPITNNGGIIGDLTFCPGANAVTYTLPPATGAGFYNWTIPAGATIIGSDNTETIVIDFTGSSGGQLCVIPSNGCTDGPQECITITQGPPPTTPDVTFNLCPGQTANYGNTVYSTQSPPGGFPNTDIQNAQGCDILTNVIVNIGQEYDIMMNETMCFDDPPIIIGGGPVPPVTGVYTFNLLTSLGCDSMITLNLTVLTPVAAASQPAAIDCGPNLIVPLEAVVLNPSPTVTYEWFGPCVVQIGLPNGTTDPIEGAACPGNYTLIVTESQNGVVCSTQPFTVQVGENTTPPIADAGVAQVIGCGTSAAVLGGTGTSTGGNFAYAWTGPPGLIDPTTSNPTATTAGQYCLTVINTTTLCQSNQSCVDVSGDLTPPNAAASASEATLTCTTTSSTLSTTGSSSGGGVTYSWTGPNGGLTGDTPSVNQSGTYTLTVTGDNGCTNTATVVIGSDTQDPTAVIDTPASLDCNNTSVSLNGTNSTGANLSYSWSGVASGNNPTSSASTSGMATLTVTNNDNGCTDQVSVMVNDNSSVISADIDVQGMITCTNNTVTLCAINVTGTTNATYTWTDPGGGTFPNNTQCITVSNSGNWGLVVSDNGNGCTSPSAAGSVVVDSNTPTATGSVSGVINCNNSSVSLSTTGSSTGGNITASWTFNNAPVADPNNITVGGIYTLTVTNSSNGCDQTFDVTVNEDLADPVAIIDVPNAIDCNNTSVTLNGNNSTGANLSYSWSGVGSGTDPTSSVGTGGMATLTVTNNDNGCTDEVSINVDDNSSVITAEIDVPAQLTCTNNQVTLSAINVTGTTNPTYVWTGPNGETGSGPTISAGTPGDWTVEVIDNSNGCTSGVITEAVVENGNLPTAIAGVSGDITCANGSVVLSTAGSSTGGTITAGWTLNNQPVSDPNNISTAGTYELTITDSSNGCTATAQVLVVEDTTEPIAVIAMPLPIDCNNTSISLDGSGSTGGNNLNLAWTDINGGTIDPNNISNAGTYVLTVTNMDNGCTSIEQIIVDDLSTTVDVTANTSGILDCSGNPVTLDVVTMTGSSNPVYTWVDGNNMIVSQGNDPMTPVLNSGTYTLTVEDATTGCSASTNVVVIEDMNTPDALVANPDDLTCITSTVTLDGTASTSGNDITYQWLDGNGNIANATNSTLDVTVAGNYSLLVTNTTNGCTQISTAVDVVLDDATPLVNAVADNNGELSCTVTSLNIDATGTTGNNLVFEWTDANGNIIGTGPMISVTAAGDVTATATNTVNGCSASQLVIIVPNADLPQINVDPVTQLDCNNNSSTLVGTGASTTGSTVTLEWFDDNMMPVPGGGSGNITTSNPGEYTFVVTDDVSGCSQTAVVNLIEDLVEPTVDAGVNQTIDCDNGTVTLNGSGSQTGPTIQYQWFDENMIAVPGGNTPIISVSNPGDYTLVVSNTANGCDASQLINVDENIEAPVFTAMALNNIDCNNMEATMEATVSSSFSTNLEYEWSNSAGVTIGTTASINTPTAGTYTVIVTDVDNGCTEMLTVDADDTTADPTVDVEFTGELNCDVLEITLDGANSSTGNDFTYQWFDSNGMIANATDLTLDIAAPGDYTLEVLNNFNGCTSTQLVNVSQDIQAPDVQANASTNLLTCTDPSATLDGSGSSIGANFSYQWFEVSGANPMLIGETINFNIEAAGTYELIVSNTTNGCTAVSGQVVIDQSSDVPVAVIDDADDLTCTTTMLTLNGGNSTAGGAISYEWTDDNNMVIGIEETLEVTTPGTVNLTITDANNGCTSAVSYIVVQDIESPQISVAPGDVINCNQPVYTLDGSGSTLDPNITYNYEWTLMGTGVVGNDLVIPDVDQEGTYELVVTNAVNGCTSTMQVEVTADFEEPTVDAGNGFTITCNDDTAPLDGSGSSTGDFSYVWTNQDGDTVSTLINAETQQPGFYTLEVTNNENGCSNTAAAIIVDINVDLPNVELGTAPTITCFNNQEVTLDGSASATGNDITYQWYLNNVAVPGATDVFLTTTDQGEYTLEVTNTTTGCVNQLAQIVDTDLIAPTAAVAGTGGTLICGQPNFPLDGSASSTGVDFTYQWIDISNGNVVWTDINYDATAPGTYELLVTDISNGCTAVSNQVTIVPSQDAPTLVFGTVETLTCDIMSTPIDASASSAVVGNLIYEWTDVNSTVVGNGPTLDVSAPGQYTLTLTDDMNNCSVAQAITVQQDITPPIPNAGIGGTLLCDNLPVTLNGGGSTGGDMYQWFDPSGILIPGATNLTLDATTPGIYTLEVTNSVNGCSATADVLVGQDINIPIADVQLDFAATLTCDVLTITADGNGSMAAGGGALQYMWSNGSTNATTTFDTPGTYTLTVLDPNNGCDVSESFVVMEDVSVPVPDISVISGTIIDCDNQSLVFNGSNSTPTSGTQLTYNWTLGGNPLGNMNEVEINTDGVLELVVTNVANGCSASTSENITTNANLPTAFIVANPDDITCLMDEVSLSGDGSSTGTQFSYEWTGPGNIVSNTTLNPSVDAPGTYTLTVFNNDNGCEQSASIIVDAEINPPLANANSTDQIDCINTEVTLDGNGSATGPNFTYQWTTTNGTIISGANTFTPTVTSAGSYTIEVTDLTNGCTAESTVQVVASVEVPEIGNAQIQIPNCFGENNGSILLNNVTGGEMPYLYSINGSALAPINQFSFLEAGEYEIMVQDINGCESTSTFIIDNPTELQVELGDDITIGLGETVDLTANSVGSYDTIFWAHCDTCNFSQIFETPLNTSSYSVTYIDGNGCVASDNITVFVEKGREVYIPNAFAPEGFNNRFHIYAGSEVARASEFRVFNRWGEQVFSRTNFDPKIQDSSNGWDGRFNNKDMNPGVFVYYAEIVYIDGRVEILKGDVTLRR